MNKKTLTGFIQKYSLGNLVESVEWNCDNKILSTNFVSEDKTMMGEVILKESHYVDLRQQLRLFWVYVIIAQVLFLY